LRSLCGRSFHGTPVDVPAVDSIIIGQTLVLNLWQCWNQEVRLAFHIGDDHSRVWVLAWDQQQLHLEHTVHDAAGEPGPVSNYGGPATGAGTAQIQNFAPDAETLRRIPTAAGSEWTLELLPDERLSYSYTADAGARRFRIDFDLRTDAPRPPSPWGWTRVTQSASDRSR
jgi:hypothetical protein